ncbi:MAG: hypothetical protein PF545_06800 [Elusimicrobia bacterium]|jgi:ABC-2 type transport system permease protein|nr:hypothetical protein [Elusimicrobiota bacterium]
MSSAFNTFKLYLGAWLKENKHNLKKLVNNKVKFFISLFLALFFMSLLFVGFYRVISYVKDTPIVGTALVARLIGTVFLALFVLLVYSSIITAFSTLYFSGDNDFLMVSPLNLKGLLYGKLVRTAVYASWMSIIVIVPLFMSLAVNFPVSLKAYILFPVAILLFFLSAAAPGMTLVVITVKIFPARKIRDFLILGLVILGTGTYVLFRMLKLEQILRPGRESLAAGYLTKFELPNSFYLPSHWISKITVEFINNRPGWWMSFIAIVLIAFFLIWLYGFIAEKFFYIGWEKVQSEEKKRFSARTFYKDPIFAKDIKTFFRDTRQWTQMLLIAALIFIYIFNIYKLPLDIPYIHYLISFLNIGMVGFVIAAVGLRFSFSSVSLEGKYFWVVMSSPFNARKVLRKKYIQNIIPVLIMGMVLIVSSNIILKAPLFLSLLSAVTVFAAAFSITSIGIGLSAIYPKFDADNPAEIESSWGGVIYMVYSFTYIGITLGLEAVWVRMYFMSKMASATYHRPTVFFIVAGLIILNIAANIIPLRAGAKSMDNLEYKV